MNELLPHQQRVVDECKVLNDKIVALSIFIDTNPVFSTLSKEDRLLLQAQLNAMTAYLTILDLRIERFQ